MKTREVSLYLVRYNHGNGEKGNWKLFICDANKSIYEELAKKYKIELTEEEEQAGVSLSLVVMSYLDVKEVDLDKLALISK